jgi:hypothetical protein
MSAILHQALVASYGGQSQNSGPSFEDVALLLHLNGTNGSTSFADSSSFVRTVTGSGNAQISTAQSKFGGASLLLDGSSSYLSTPDNADFTLSNRDFTIECWVWLSEYPPIQAGIFNHVVGTGNANGSVRIEVLDSGSLRVLLQSSSGVFFGGTGVAPGYTFPIDQWVHVAFSRQGGNGRLFADGVLLENKSLGSTAVFDPSGPVLIGANRTDEQFLDGYIDEFRITLDNAIYTANFTPPTAPFPDE